jgi:hypothetical protein
MGRPRDGIAIAACARRAGRQAAPEIGRELDGLEVFGRIAGVAAREELVADVERELYSG